MRSAVAFTACASVAAMLVLVGCAAAEQSDGVPARPSAPTAADQPGGVAAEPFDPVASSSVPLSVATSDRVDRELEAQLHAEYTDRFMSCMSELGMTVTELDDGGFEVIGDGTPESVNLAQEECLARVGTVAPYAPVTAEEADALYDLELAVKVCLEEQEVNVSEPPSRENFIESYLAHSKGVTTVSPWSAYRAVLDPSELEEICPPATLSGIEW